jgi:hypothetical protein
MEFVRLGKFFLRTPLSTMLQLLCLSFLESKDPLRFDKSSFVATRYCMMVRFSGTRRRVGLCVIL